MKRILVIAPRYPLPETDGASMRTMNFVRYFKGHGEVDIVCRRSTSTPASPESIFSNIYFIDSDRTEMSRFNIGRVLDKVVRLKTWSTSHFTEEIEQVIRKIVVAGRYDVILCRYLAEAYPLLKLDRDLRKKVILDVDDIVTQTLYEAETAGFSGIDKVAKAIDRYVLRRYHARCMCFRSILFCSDEDRQEAKVPQKASKAHVVPNTLPVSVQPALPTDGYANIQHLLFVGSLKYLPNFHGISWFIEKVFPDVVGEYSDVKLTVVGRNPPRELVEMVSRFPQIDIHGDVPNVSSYYEKTGVSVVPLLAGGGTRIKILESGFAGRPVISTAVGAYGLGMCDGKEIMIFSDSQSFLCKYRSLRENRGRYSEVTQCIANFVRDNFSYRNFEAAMDRVLGRLM